MNNTEYYHKLESLLETNTPLWQATVISTDGSTPAKPGMKACIGLGDIYFGNLGGGEMEHSIIARIRSDAPDKPTQLSFDLGEPNRGRSAPASSVDSVTIGTSMICGGQAQVFIEPLHKTKSMYIIGGGHCGKALAHLAELTGFSVCVIDNREEVLKEANEQYRVRTLHSDYTDIAGLIREPNPLVVIMTHGHVHDKAVLEQCLELNCRYLGMIGSKTKVKETFAKLVAQGISTESLASVHAPIGLPIGSQTPYEIAISIMAEIIREGLKP